MKEITIKLKGRDSWISVILGIYGALGAFISLSAGSNIDNSPDIDLESQIMLYTRTMYRSFSFQSSADFFICTCDRHTGLYGPAIQPNL